MFYTKYRPQKFADLVDLDKNAKALGDQIAASEVPHAMFFSGPRGTGKTTTARLVAKALNCLDLKGIEPCNKCANCKAINASRFLDLIEIDAASNRGIDDIRDLREKIKLAPTSGKYKVYIIDEVHMLTTEAFNALLKTLEEPPAHAVFILATTDPQKVPATIKSRCQKFEFKRASTLSLIKKMKRITEDQGVEIPEADLLLIAQAAAGGFRDAETLLEEVIKGGVTTREAIGLSTEVKVIDFVDALVLGQADVAITIINEVYESGVDLTVWTRELLEYLRKLMLFEVGLGQSLVDVSKEQYIKLESQCKGLINQTPTILYVEVFIKAYENLKNAAIPQLPLEVAVLQIIGKQITENIKSVGTGRDLSENKEHITENRKQKLIVTGRSSDSLPILTGSELYETAEMPSKANRSVAHEASTLTLNEVKQKWDEVLIGIRPYNHSLEAVLRSCFPAGVEGGQLIIGTPYKFHQEKLNDAKNYQAVSEVLTTVYGQKLDFKCQIGKKEVTAEEKSKEVEKKAKKAFTGEIVV